MYKNTAELISFQPEQCVHWLHFVAFMIPNSANKDDQIFI